MADLKEVRSSDKTAEEVMLFHCTIVNGKMSTCYSLQLSKLNKMVLMGYSCHSGLVLDKRGQWDLN